MQREIYFGQALFAMGGVPKTEFKDYPGSDPIAIFCFKQCD